MKRLIMNPKNEKAIIAEIVGENGLLIEKRRQDHHPVKVFIKGTDYDAVVNCTLTGEPIHIECVDGKISTEELIIEERNDNGEKINQETGPTGASGPEANPGDDDNGGASGPSTDESGAE